MKEKVMKLKNAILAVTLMPVISGCGVGGAAGLGSLGSLFAFSSGSGGGAGAGLLASAGGAGGVATIHQPEPTTMLLMGGGLIAMHYLKNKVKIK